MTTGGSTQTSSGSQTSAAGPYAKYGMNQAGQLYSGTMPQYYPGNTVAAQSPYTQAALQGTAARAVNGSPLNTAASGYLQDVMAGKYLNAGNPYQAALDQSIQASVIPAVNSQFSAAGRYGSPAQAGTETTALTNALAPFQYGNYQQERAQQMGAAQQAPVQAGQDYVDLGQLAAAGNAQDQYGQNLINSNINRWNFAQNEPMNWLQQYTGIVNGANVGTQSTQTQTQPGGGFTGFLGGLLGGLL